LTSMRRDVDSARTGKMAGVSRSAAANVVNNYTDISQATRAKVRAAIRERQCHLAPWAHILAGRTTETIGVFPQVQGTRLKTLS
jgi:DNA-binding LacI/PurR family transcriptional regulator